MNGSRPSEARDRVLAQLPPEKQLEVMQRAEKRGPRPDDPDWLLIETMMACAARMEAATPMTEKALEAFAERIERVEQGVDNVKGRLEKAKIGDRDDVPGLRNPQLDRIEARLHEQASKLAGLDAVVRAGSTPGIQPLAVHAVAVAVLLAVFAAGYFSRTLNPAGTILVVALCAVLAYTYLAPLLAPSLAGGLRRLQR